MDTNRLEKEIQLLVDSEEKSKRHARKGKGAGWWILMLIIVGGLVFGYRWWKSVRSAAANTTNAQSTENGGYACLPARARDCRGFEHSDSPQSG